MWTIIDIGSNSIRAMDISDEGVFSQKRLFTTRLAEDLDQTGVLKAENMLLSADAVEGCVREARKQGGQAHAYATSAVRDAGNRADFLNMLCDRCGIEVDVLSGAQEARYARIGAQCEGLLDIGGGSSQLCAEGFAQSWPIGCVRASELRTRDAIETRCRELFRFPRIRVMDWAGVGGTLTTLAALQLGLDSYDRAAVKKARLSPESIEELILRLQNMGEERRKHPLLVKRHDVIIPGAILACCILRGMSIESLRISDADGMEGYYLECVKPMEKR